MTQEPPHRPPAFPAALESALYVDDLAAAEHFYGSVLGLKQVARVAGRHVFFRVGTSVLLIFDPAVSATGSDNPELPVPAHGAYGTGHFCFAAGAADITAWRSWLKAAGVPIEADFHWPGGARSLYFRDPAGNSLEIAEPRLWS